MWGAKKEETQRSVWPVQADGKEAGGAKKKSKNKVIGATFFPLLMEGQGVCHKRDSLPKHCADETAHWQSKRARELSPRGEGFEGKKTHKNVIKNACCDCVLLCLLSYISTVGSWTSHSCTNKFKRQQQKHSNTGQHPACRMTRDGKRK